MIVTPEMTRRMSHLLSEEKKVWIRFLTIHGDDFSGYEYDVHVGRPATMPAGFPPGYSKMVDRLSTRRIDVVAHKGEQTFIFEVRPFPVLENIDRLLLYVDFYQRDLLPFLRPIPALVFTEIKEDVLKSAVDNYLMTFKV